MPVEIKCSLCGEIKYGRIRNQRFCNDCHKNRHSEICSIYNKQRYSSEIEEKAALEMSGVEWEKPTFSLQEVAAAARKHNMSYGKYVVEWGLGTVPEPEHIEPQKKKRG